MTASPAADHRSRKTSKAIMFEPIRRRERFETSTVLPNRGSRVESRPDTLLLRETMGDASELVLGFEMCGEGLAAHARFPQSTQRHSLSMEGQIH